MKCEHCGKEHDRAGGAAVIKLLREWQSARRRSKERAHFARGYEWAKNALVTGNYSVSALRALAEGAFNYGPYDRAFDRGVNAACNDVETRESSV